MVCRLRPKDRDARSKLAACDRAVREVSPTLVYLYAMTVTTDGLCRCFSLTMVHRQRSQRPS